jgi:hypothetical protein
MRTNTAKTMLFLLLCLALFGCGDLGIVLPRDGTYRIRTLVNDNSLGDCSLIQAGDMIRPYCDSSVTEDPDVRGILVLILNSQKETVGRNVRYVLKGYATDMPVEEDASNLDSKTEKIELEENVLESTEGDEDTSEVISEDGPIEETEDIVIVVDRLDSKLPPFTMPENLEIGLYTLVFRVFGEREIFGETEEKFYYLGNARFSLNDIQMYLPGVFSESRLIPPGTTVLLEANIDADPRLHPYIVWYNGKKPIGEGRLSSGAGLIFWEAPEQTGFQTLRAEIFPSYNRQGINGISREIVLPVSAKAPKAGFFSFQSPAELDWLGVKTVLDSETPARINSEQKAELLRWYHFAGNFDDSRYPLAENSLMPLTERPPRWKALGYYYGLAAGAYDSYYLAPLSFIHRGDSGGGAFLFRFKPDSDGNLMNALFASTASNAQVKMNLLLKENKIFLQLSRGEIQSKEISIPVDSESASHITIAVVFYLYNDRLEAKLVPEKSSPAQAEITSIKNSEALSGECRISLGDPDNSADSSAEMSGQLSERTAPSRPFTAIWTQLAVLYIDPPEPEEVKEEAAETADLIEETAIAYKIADHETMKSPAPEAESGKNAQVPRTAPENSRQQANAEQKTAIAEIPEQEPAEALSADPESQDPLYSASE